jgi:hypothetical protein
VHAKQQMRQQPDKGKDSERRHQRVVNGGRSGIQSNCSPHPRYVLHG